MSEKRPFNLPMALTWTRVIFVPFIIAVFYIPDFILSPHWQNVLACVMFVIAAVTDALDGFFARRWKMTSSFGAFLDTVADKFVVCSAIIMLLACGRIDMIIAIIIVSRELAVTALREWMAKIGAGAIVKVNWFGKIKTIAQMVAIPMLLWWDPIMGFPVATVGLVLIWIAAALTLYSMWVYMTAAWPHLETADEEPVKPAAGETKTTKP